MARVLKILLSWLLVVTGAYLIITGARTYYVSRNTQSEIAEYWTDKTPGPAVIAPDLPELKSPESKQRQAKRQLEQPKRGSPIAHLLIPRLDANLFVLEGTDQRTLKVAPGHMEGTSLPGGQGNCVIAGHRDTHFRVLQNIRKGDEIVLESQGSRHAYRVSELSVISPSDTRCLDNTNQAVLNLITCYPFHYVGSAPKRFVVHADLETPGT